MNKDKIKMAMITWSKFLLVPKGGNYEKLLVSWCFVCEAILLQRQNGFGGLLSYDKPS